MFQAFQGLFARGAEQNKAACRAGLQASQRPSQWLDLAITIGDVKTDASPLNCGNPLHKEALLREKAKRDHYFRAALLEVFGNLDPLPAKIFRLAFLGVEPAILPEEATVLLAQPSIAVSAAHDRVISVLAQLHSLRYCPQVPNLALVLLSYLSESDTFAAMESLLTHNKAVPMLLLSKREETAFIKTFRTLVKSYYPQLSAHLESLGGPVRAIYASWFRGFFTGWIPTEDVHRVVDSYLLEGPKVLIRFGLAFLKILKRKLKATPNPNEIDRCFRRWVAKAVVRKHLAIIRAAGTAAGADVSSSSLSGSASSPHDASAEAASAASSAVLANIPPHLIADLSNEHSDSATGGGGGEEEPYSFELLRDTAFEGISGLSRATITKLMDKYLNSSSSTAAASSAAAPAAPGAAADGIAASNLNSVSNSGARSIATRSRLGSDAGEQTITIPSQNAILTVGHNSMATNATNGSIGSGTNGKLPGETYLSASSAQSISAASSSSSSMFDVTENGVVYDYLGLDPEDAAASSAMGPVGLWSNPKIVGIGTRLMTGDFSPADASAFLGRINSGHKRLHHDTYAPHVASLNDVFVTARGGAGGTVDEAASAANNNNTIVRTAGWIQGLKAHLGLAPDQTIGALATVAGGSAAAAAAGNGGFVPSYGRAASQLSSHPHKPTIAEIFGRPPATTGASAGAAAAPSHPDPHADAVGVAEGDRASDSGHRASAGVPNIHLPSGDSSSTDMTTPVVTKAPGTGRLQSSSEVVVAFSVASSPYLASLCTLLPSGVSTLNWACLYSTDIHGSSLDTLYSLTGGFAPLMVFIQAQVKTAASAGDGDGSSASASSAAAITTTSSATASKLATAVSSKRPVFGFFASRGLRPSTLLMNNAAPAADSRGVTTHASSRPGSGFGARADVTYGGRNDFLFQLFPEVSLFPVSNVEPASSGSGGGTGGNGGSGGVGSSGGDTSASSLSHADLVGTGHRTMLSRDHFLTCLPEHLCVGGVPGKAGSHALRIARDCGTAVASKSFLLDMSVPLPPAASAATGSASGSAGGQGGEEVQLDLLAIEAYAFLDRQGNFQDTREKSPAIESALYHAKKHYLRNLKRYWESDVATK